MRHWRSLLVASFAALLIPASGFGSVGGPPWETDTFNDCPPPNSQLLVRCTHAESSNGQTGDAALDLTLISRGQGYLPGVGSNYSDLYFRLPSVSVPVATTKLVAKANLLVRSASVTTTGRLGGHLTTAFGDVSGLLFIGINQCAFSHYYDCSAVAYETITYSGSPAVQNQAFEILVTLRPPDGETFAAGTVLMEFVLSARGALGPAYSVGTGSVHTTADIQFTGFQLSYTAA